jgi:cytochrome b6-f complex iron-sulfur subunit
VSQKRPTSRRNFLTQALSGWIFVSVLPVVYALIEYIIPPRIRETILQSINIGKISDIPANGAKIIKFNKKAIILIRTEQNQVRALSAICTHLGCIVEYKPDQKNFKCNCHGSVFDLTGKNIAGPAPVPLKPYRVELKQDEVIISQAEEDLHVR